MWEAWVQLSKRVALPAAAIVWGGLLANTFTAIDDGACDHFEGRLAGNDPCSWIRVDLCREGEDLRGFLHTHGQSGTSVTEVAGAVTGIGQLELRHVEVLLNQPNPGWSFCFDDHLELAFDPLSGSLAGTYTSAECDDHGELVLR